METPEPGGTARNQDQDPFDILLIDNSKSQTIQVMPKDEESAGDLALSIEQYQVALEDYVLPLIDSKTKASTREVISSYE